MREPERERERERERDVMGGERKMNKKIIYTYAI